jgi:hypothetical protein
MWLNIDKATYDPDVNVYKEFDDFSGDKSTDVTAITGMRRDRDLSYNNLMKEMKRRKILRADLDPEQNMEELLSETNVNDVTDPNAVDDTGGTPSPSPSTRPKPKLVKP